MKQVFGVVLLALGLLLSAHAAEVNEATAQQAIAAQHFSEAREIYRQLLKQQPDNLVYQNWVARLSAWLKEYQVALDAYDAALARAPENAEALLGKAYVHMWQRQFTEAEALLQLVRKQSAQQLAWQLAMFSFYSLQGKLQLAREHLEAARALDPQNPELPVLEKQLHGRAPLTVQAGFETQRLQYLSPDIPAFNSFFFDVVWRRERDTFGLHFEKDELGANQHVRTGWNFSHRFGDGFWLRGSALLAAGAQALPQRDWSVGAAWRLKGQWAQRFILSGDYRRIRLPQTTAQVISPTVEYVPDERSHWQATVFRSWQPQANGNAINGRSFLLRYDRQLAKPLRASLTWTQVQQATQCGAACTRAILRQRGMSGAVSYQLNEHLTVNTHYGLLRSSNGARQNTFGISLAVY